MAAWTFIVFGVLASGFVAQAQTPVAAPTASNWYFYLGTGFAPFPQHDSTLQNQIGQAHAQGLWSIVAGNLSLPGIYYRTSERRLYGVLPSFLFETYGRDATDTRNFSVRSYSLMFSWLEFLSPNMGQGLFFRGDLGLNYFETDSQSLPNISDSYGAGATLQLGVGYGYDFFNVGHSLIQAGPYVTQSGSHTLYGLLLQIGVLL